MADIKSHLVTLYTRSFGITLASPLSYCDYWTQHALTLSGKEVIQLDLLVRLPCDDFTPVTVMGSRAPSPPPKRALSNLEIIY